jgi:hypothetical protein
MRKTAIALFAALPATLLMMSWSYALPSCCQGGNSPPPINYFVSVPEGTPRALDVRAKAPDYRELPGQTARVSLQRSGSGYRGCGAAANLRGCRASGAYGQGLTQSNVPACCAADNVQTSPGLSVSNHNANPVPATVGRARTPDRWGVYPAGAGPFEKPGYFPGAQAWQNTW